MTKNTLGGLFERSGVGLHSGILTKVRVLPAAGEGRYFVRVDLPGEPVIPARVDAVSQTKLSTQLCVPTTTDRDAINHVSINGEVSVRTVEHLLAALAGTGVDEARIEIDGPEVPLLDGSAKVWVEAIANVGIVPEERELGSWGAGGARGAGEAGGVGGVGEDTRQQSLLRENRFSSSPFVLQEPVWVYQGDAFVAALPAPVTRFTYGIDFENPVIGNQWHSWLPQQESFACAIAPARTFGLASQIDQLREAGLIKGGSLENALVCDDQGWLNPPLRFSNEPARHKLLDLVGDLSLLGTFPVAHFLAYKASHNLHVQLAKKLAQQMG